MRKRYTFTSSRLAIEGFMHAESSLEHAQLSDDEIYKGGPNQNCYDDIQQLYGLLCPRGLQRRPDVKTAAKQSPRGLCP